MRLSLKSMVGQISDVSYLIEEVYELHMYVYNVNIP
jgi:hypothetical protein